jgi:hypothetical protein
LADQFGFWLVFTVQACSATGPRFPQTLSPELPTELVADKGYHSRAVLKALADGPWQTRIAEPKPKDVQRWPSPTSRSVDITGSSSRDGASATANGPACTKL